MILIRGMISKLRKKNVKSLTKDSRNYETFDKRQV